MQDRPFLGRSGGGPAAREVNRPALLKAFRAYLQANDLDADWDSVSRADNAMLVNALSMMAPYGAAEKQALLEAPDLKTPGRDADRDNRDGAGARQRGFRIEPAVGLGRHPDQFTASSSR